MSAQELGKKFLILKCLGYASIYWIFGTYVLFLLGHDLTLEQVTLINTAFMTITFVLDPITGVVSDRFGQVKTYVAGQFFWMLSMFTYSMGQTFWQFVFAEGLGAVGAALTSNSLESLIRNTTGSEEAHKIISKASGTSRIVTIPAAILGTMVGAKFGMNVPWIIGGLFFAANVILSTIMLRKYKEVVITDQDGLIESRKYLKDAVKMMFNVPELRFALIIGIMFNACMQPLNMFWAPILKEMTNSASWLGSMSLATSIPTALGMYLVANLGKKSNEKYISFVFIVLGIGVLGASKASAIPILLIYFMAHEAGRGALEPLIFTYTNNKIPNYLRSTANSVRTGLATFGSALGLILFGKLTNYMDPIQTWTVSGLILFGTSVFGLMCYYAKKVKIKVKIEVKIMAPIQAWTISELILFETAIFGLVCYYAKKVKIDVKTEVKIEVVETE